MQNNKICWSAISRGSTKPVGHIHQEQHISPTHFPRESIWPTLPLSLGLYLYFVACKTNLFKTTSLFGIAIEVLDVYFGLSMALTFYGHCLPITLCFHLQFHIPVLAAEFYFNTNLKGVREFKWSYSNKALSISKQFLPIIKNKKTGPKRSHLCFYFF